MATLVHDEARAHRLLDRATAGVPGAVLASLDAVSRRWIAAACPQHLPEIEAIAHRLARPGAYFLSVSYEWGCSCKVAPSADGASARLVRVLDWRVPGLGAGVMAVRVAGPAGPFVTLTWPGYTGVLQAMAPGRFSATFNQAPLRTGSGLYALDWLAARRRVWHTRATTAGHLLRHVCENAADFAEAARLLTTTPIAAPCIYLLAGLGHEETIIIERTEVEARCHPGPRVAANHWQARGWRGRPRGHDSGGRARSMAAVAPVMDPAFPWLVAPMLNPLTRLVMVADARRDWLVARGYEARHPATATLELTAPAPVLARRHAV
ncbi:MAG: hypothetical protein NW205_09800 [Hyphomicrobiaceae bacterium]|nr:hypothetical protein [Hyphomicrobiaceae bacterium]